MVGEEVGVPPEKFRLWAMVGRQNKTVRPDVPIAEGLADCRKRSRFLIVRASLSLIFFNGSNGGHRQEVQ